MVSSKFPKRKRFVCATNFVVLGLTLFSVVDMSLLHDDRTAYLPFNLWELEKECDCWSP